MPSVYNVLQRWTLANVPLDLFDPPNPFVAEAGAMAHELCTQSYDTLADSMNEPYNYLFGSAGCNAFHAFYRYRFAALVLAVPRQLR